MYKTLLYIFVGMGLFFWGAAAQASRLITFHKGKLLLQTEKGMKKAPRAPFRLKDGQTLILKAGAVATSLGAGGSKRHSGPTKIREKSAKDKTSRISRAARRKMPRRRIGASRSSPGFELIRPIDGTAALSLREIRWSCDTCGELLVELQDTDEMPVWDSSGLGTVSFDGEELEPGTYTILLNQEQFSFTISDPKIGEEISQVMADIRDLEPLPTDFELISAEAALLYQAELETELLYFLDQKLSAHPQDSEYQELFSNYRQKFKERQNTETESQEEELEDIPAPEAASEKPAGERSFCTRFFRFFTSPFRKE